MLCAIHTSLSFNLHDICDNNRTVAVGREADNAIRLDSPTVPYLLSRHHATLVFQSDGGILLTDLSSTNGTYVSRSSGAFRRLQARNNSSSSTGSDQHATWNLQPNDVIGFGGPDTIVADTGDVVPNPFMFRYRRQIIYEPPSSPDHVMSEQQQAANHHDTRDDQGREVIEIDIDSSPNCSPSTSGRDGPSYAPPHPSTAAASGGAQQQQPPRDQQQQQLPGVGPAALAGGGGGCCHGGAAGGTNGGSGGGSSITDIVSKHLTCPICQDLLLASHMLPCGHLFCGLCLAKWLALAERQSCPACRKPVSRLPIRCFQVDGTISDLLSSSNQIMSPGGQVDRRRKQRHWEGIQHSVEQDWSVSLQHKRQHTAGRTNNVPPIIVGAMVEPRMVAHPQQAQAGNGTNRASNNTTAA